MGIPIGGTVDLSLAPVTGTLGAVGNGSPFQPAPGEFNLLIYGTFVATIVVEKTSNAGTTYVPLSIDLYGTAISLTGPVALQLNDEEQGNSYRIRTTAWTSGTVSYRWSQ
jgi:hypothetical protein